MSTRTIKKLPRDADALRMLEPLSRDDPAMQEMLAEERSNAAVARQIYELRTAKGLTQQQLAELIGTKQPVIARLEDADDPHDHLDAALGAQAYQLTRYYAELPESRGKTIGAARGLSGPDVAKGQMAIFSAGRNQKALDALNASDKHPNGVFTRELVKRMREQGLPLKALAESVRDAVEQLAQTVRHEQRPLVVSDLVGDFYLYPGAGTQVAKATPAAALPQDDA